MFWFLKLDSEEEARMKIYSVSHRCYFAFGALVSEDLSHKLKGFIFSPVMCLNLRFNCLM